VSDAAVGHHGRSRPDACSVVWDSVQGSALGTALGTAPLASFWVALEQNGPWGARAATQSHLDPDLGRILDQQCQEGGGRFILIRRPGRHPDPDNGNLHRTYVAGGLAGRPWLLEADLSDPARLTRLPWLSLPGSGSDSLDAIRRALPELRVSASPVLMICSNSRRDVCCSVRGRPVAIESAFQRPGQVWECSHTGGHRFAPTGVLLPQGQVLGRLSGISAVAAVDAAGLGELPVELLGETHDRGRSHLIAPAQAAESTVRQQIQEPHFAALSTTATALPRQENAWHCRVIHVDGRHWDVLAARSPGGAELPESCGKEPVPSWQWSISVTSVLTDHGPPITDHRPPTTDH